MEKQTTLQTAQGQILPPCSQCVVFYTLSISSEMIGTNLRAKVLISVTEGMSIL